MYCVYILYRCISLKMTTEWLKQQITQTVGFECTCPEKCLPLKGKKCITVIKKCCLTNSSIRMRISLYIVCWLVEYLTATVHLSVCSKPCVHILSLIRPELQMKVCENSFLSQRAAKYLLFQVVGSNRWNFSSRPPCSMCRGAVGVLSACLFKIQIIIVWFYYPTDISQTLIDLIKNSKPFRCLSAYILLLLSTPIYLF